MVFIENGQPIDHNTVISTVVKHMYVFDYYIREDNKLEFSIKDSHTLKDDFQKLLNSLKSYEMIATLRKNDNYLTVTVGNISLHKTRLKDWMPIALLVIVIGIVLYDGFLRSQTISGEAYIKDPWEMAMIYTVSLMGILGIHELGHILAAKKYKIKFTWPFFIPGFPGVFPTFGAVIFTRSHMPNRDVLFDIGFAGPIAGLIVTIVVSVYGAAISPLIPIEQVDVLLSESQLIKLNPSILMLGSYFLAGKIVEGFTPLMSPIAFAAWIGFLVTFLNLLPAWQLDGGHIARAAIGKKWHKRTTFMSIITLAGLGYVIMALLILIMNSRSPDVKPLDDVSPLSKSRRNLFIISLFLALLCAPFPFSFNF
ncbi:MAG: site-2 protease family protein [Thaumarchaeota archaeon]|nr:site-2 protease family protein [Nitrososphaerota archaeon]